MHKNDRQREMLANRVPSNCGILYSSIFLHFTDFHRKPIIFINKTTKESKKWKQKVTVSADLPFTYLRVEGFPGGSDSQESTCNAWDPGSVHGSGRSPGERNGNPLSILAWRIPWTEKPGWLQSKGNAKSQTQRGTHTHKPQFAYVWHMVKNPPATEGGKRDPDSIPGSGRLPGGGNGNPLQYSCLEIPMDRGYWRTRLSTHMHTSLSFLF